MHRGSTANTVNSCRKIHHLDSKRVQGLVLCVRVMPPTVISGRLVPLRCSLIVGPQHAVKADQTDFSGLQLVDCEKHRTQSSGGLALAELRIKLHPLRRVIEVPEGKLPLVVDEGARTEVIRARPEMLNRSAVRRV